jgi:hypothetical protein
MSQFTTPFIGELVGKNLWKVREPFEYHVGSYPSEEIIKVPVGFRTDFASVPRIFWPIISPVDEHGKAAALHDFMYAEGLYSNRKRCDEIFLEALEVLGVNKWKRNIMYFMVRTFSFYSWWRCRHGFRK